MAFPLAPLVLVALLVDTSAALAQAMACSGPSVPTELVDADRQRLLDLLASRSRGLGAALTAESGADRDAVGALFSPGFEPLESVPDGRYRCRTMKLGGLTPLTVYGQFSCTIRNGGTEIEKTSGSQRFLGSLTPAPGGLLYVGALHYGDEQPISYGEKLERNQVGCLQRVAGAAEQFILELPSPKFESVHDVIELTPER